MTVFISNFLLNGSGDFSSGAYCCANQNINFKRLEFLVLVCFT